MRVYRPTWKDKNGQRHTSETWWLDWTDSDGRRRRIPGLTDKRQTEALARNVERLRGVRGDVPPVELVRWLEAQPVEFRRRLAEAGLIDSQRAGGMAPLMALDAGEKIVGGHLADFLADAAARGVGESQRATLGQRIRDIFKTAGTVYPRDLSAARIQAAIAKIGAPTPGNIEGLSLQSLHHYVRAAQQFSRWLYRERRTSEDMLLGIKGYNADTDKRRDRRGFTADEMQWLLATTKTSETRGAMSAKARAAVYALAFGSGLRRNEIKTLTRASFDLEANPPTVTVEAAYSKHRRQDVQPLPADVAATLAEYLSEADADHPFPMPVRAAEMLRADMTAARKAWIAGGHNEQERHARENDRDFLMPRDSSGRVLDVHSFRHGYVTAICKAAVSPRVMMSLARHSDPRLTMKRYSRVAIADTAGALAMLPKLGETTGKSDDATSLRATGTDSANATQDAPQCPRSDDQPTARPMDPPPLRLTADTLAQGTENHRVSAFAKLGDKVRIPANANEQQAEQIDSSKSVALQGKPAYSEGVAGSGGVRRPGGAPGLQNQSGKTTAADASRTCDKPPSRACQSLCQILAEITPSDPELAAIVKAWPHLSPAIREALAKMATGSANTHHKKGGQK